jgi:predicted nucleic acid-binding protein
MDAVVVVDASVWVSSLIAQDVNHIASRAWMKAFTTTGGSFMSPTFLQIEVASAVSRLTKDPVVARQAVDDLVRTTRMEFVSMHDTLVQTAINVGIELQLRAGDTVYVAVAHQLGIPLVSWDKEHLNRATSFITTYSPDTYIF